MKESDIIEEAKEMFKAACDDEAQSDNRTRADADLRFGRLGEQYDPRVRAARERQGKPCLTINRIPAFIRQVVNDARQNKPQIKVRPVDDNADVETAKVINGIIRHIEQASQAGIAYDTAIEYAVAANVGYMRVDIEYLHDDTFDTDIRIRPVENISSVYYDPWATAPDGSDWSFAFVTDYLPEKMFERRYKGAEKCNWDGVEIPWRTDDGVLVVEYWHRDEVDRPIVLLSNGQVVEAALYEQHREAYYDPFGVAVQAERMTKGHDVTQRILTANEVLDETKWAGRSIPIVPVYGDRVNIGGRVYLRSLVSDAKDSQAMYNYWRSVSTELVAMAPKAPFIGPEGAFDADRNKWETANTESWPFMQYSGDVPPQRQPFVGVPAGVIQEALTSSDDMKAVMGIHDASLGARSNETSGRAIMARQREGDVSTFHFIDNLSRGITCVGRQILDLIPHVYGQRRIARVLGEDGDTEMVPLRQEIQQEDGTSRIYDVGAGNYDLVVDVGPSFTTRREEAATQMMEMMRAFPAAVPVVGDILARNLDWPGADEIADRLERLQQQGQQGQQGPDPEKQKLMAEAAQAQADVEKMRNDRVIDVEKLKIDAFEAETDRMKVQHEMQRDRATAMGVLGYGQ